ncbi:Protein LIFEGUARD 4 [Linum perenne]
MQCGLMTVKIFMESWGLTITVFASLSFYSLKAARKGLDFSFMKLYLLKAAIALMLLLFLLILFPQGRSVFFFSHLILAGFGSTVYGSYIVYLTHDLVTRFPYEEHIWASLSLYIYTIALFLFFFLLITC